MTYRTFFPARPPVFYRLLVPLPLTVVFPSVTYEVSLQSVLSAGRHELVAHDAKTGTWPTLSPVYHGREILELAVFKAGFPVRTASISEVVLRRLVQEGRAEKVPAPDHDLAERRPATGERLGAWLNVRRDGRPVPA